jgi:hypothetical protein
MALLSKLPVINEKAEKWISLNLITLDFYYICYRKKSFPPSKRGLNGL